MAQNNIRELLLNHLLFRGKIESIDEVIPYINDLISKKHSLYRDNASNKMRYWCNKKAKKHFGNQFSVGVGTVINKTQISAVIEANVDFIVLPGVFPELKEPRII